MKSPVEKEVCPIPLENRMERNALSPLMECILKRRSVRTYSDRPVEEEKIGAVLEAARWAPSACNTQCWRFVVVRERQKIEALARKGLGGIVPNRWARKAPVIMAACADLTLFTHRIGGGLKGIEYHMLDLGCAVEHLVLRAVELGLGSCWIGWFKQKAIREILRIPSRVRIAALVSIGYPAPEKEKKRKRRSLEEIAFLDEYGKRAPWSRLTERPFPGRADRTCSHPFLPDGGRKGLRSCCKGFLHRSG